MFEHDCLDTCCFGCLICKFCICTCSAQLSMFHMEKCSRNTLVITINIIMIHSSFVWLGLLMCTLIQFCVLWVCRFLFFFKPSLLLSWMFEHDCLDTCWVELSVLYACVSYFCICTCSVQLSMFHMVMHSRNTIIIIIIIIIIIMNTSSSSVFPSYISEVHHFG